MSTIVVNQKRAFLASAMDDAKNLAESLKFLSDAQRAAILAIVAKNSDTPVDITLIGAMGDEIEAYMITDGVLDRAAAGPFSWKLGNGCVFRVELEEWPAR